MSIRLGIYDFFAYTIPGGLYLFAILYIIIKLTSLNIDLAQITIVQVLFFSIAAYVSGLILDPLAKKLWYSYFEVKNLMSEVLAELNTRNDNISFPSVKIDWYVLLAYIKHQNMEMAVDIERLKAPKLCLEMSVLPFYFTLCYQLLT